MLETKTYTSYVGDPIGLPSKEQLEAEYPSTKYTIVSGMWNTDQIWTMNRFCGSKRAARSINSMRIRSS
ncbi:hypothetical protein [Dubosiella newyorkensis]|uniref:hypothetical protein n=1 Tax=Dubosiella newyorkensis TaxID=1862672 RepID=UPI0027296FFF|nr:hypothetical protein [Dubosiella newyorkensis]